MAQIENRELGYQWCDPCSIIWLDGGGAGHVAMNESSPQKQASDVPCPQCRTIFLETQFLDTHQKMAFQSCRRCSGVKLLYSGELLKLCMELGNESLGAFLASVRLWRSQEKSFKKTNQLPATFNIEKEEETDFKCPTCTAALTRYMTFDKRKDAGAEFEICDACFGIWLDKEDLLQHERKREVKHLEVDFESISPSHRVCPKCRDINLVVMCFKDVATEIDCCPSCFGTWLDGGELQEFCKFLDKDDHDVIDALIDNAVFQQPALCKMLKQFSQTLHNLDSQVQEQEKNMQQARDIQVKLLFGNKPADSLEPQPFAGFEVIHFWQPAREVGGDYFDLIPFQKDGRDQLGICVADVSGKGLPASLLMANFQALLRAFAPNTPSPAELCSQLNAILFQNTAANKYITAFYGVLDLESGRLTFTNAGHNKPLLATETECQWLHTGGTMLGLFPDWAFTEKTIELTGNERVLFYTDGVSEVEDASGDPFDDDRLLAMFESLKGETIVDAMRKMVRTLQEFSLGNFFDDATMLLLGRRKP